MVINQRHKSVNANRIHYLFPPLFCYPQNNLQLLAYKCVYLLCCRKADSKQDVSCLTSGRHHFGFRTNDEQIDGQMEPLRQFRFLIHTPL